MFSKPKSDSASPQGDTSAKQAQPAAGAPATPAAVPAIPERTGAPSPSSHQPKAKPAPSLLSQDLVIQGNVFTEGDIQIEGTVEGDVRASLLTVGESALVRGELLAENVVVHGQVVGRLRGRKVRLATTAQVDGDIIHKTIAIEAGARFEGSVQRQDDPLAQSDQKSTVTSIKNGKPTSGSAASTAAE